MPKYIIAIDQSTAGTKAVLFNEASDIVARYDVAHKQIIDNRGWVEHSPDEIYANMVLAVQKVLQNSGVPAQQVVGIGLSNQRETAIVWDKHTGKPVYNAIVWQCARGEAICNDILTLGVGEEIREATGIPLSPYYSAAKIAWVLQNVPAVQKLADEKALCCSTMDSWLVYKLCGGSPKTDYSNASRTQLFNIDKLHWDETVCGYFGIDNSMLPEVCDSNALYGYTDIGGVLPQKVPLHAVMGDSHGALYGQGCLKPGMVKATYGTGSSIMMNIGRQPHRSDKGIVTSLAWSMNGKAEYVFEGNINYTGAVIKWLVEDLELIESAKEVSALAERAAKVPGLYLVPAFSGLGAPYWRGDARAMICGMNRETGKKEIARAAEECIAYQIADIVFLMEEETGRQIEVLRVDGGPTKDVFLMQFQADILQNKVQVSNVEELSASGVAFAAGLALGIFDEEVFEKPFLKIYKPQMTQQKKEELYIGWKKAVAKTL